jgi:hypothetical protein
MTMNNKMTAARKRQGPPGECQMGTKEDLMPEGPSGLPKGQGSVASDLPSSAAGEMLSKLELAGRLKIAVRTVENWQRRGILSYIKIGKVVLFHWPDVVAYLKCNYQVSRRSLRIRREVVVGADLPGGAR